jgi:type IV secretory pathway VirB10-like protein
MGTRHRLPHRLGVVAGLGAIAAMGMITAGCAGEKEKAPESSTTTTTTTTTTSPAAPVSPTEKAPRLEPGGANQFTPSVHAPPPQTALPGSAGRHQDMNP